MDDEEESTVFSHKNWGIMPQNGEIYPSGFKDFTVTFEPNEARNYEDEFWLQCSGRQHAIPINLVGTAIGPKALFSWDILNVGAIYIGALYQYRISLHNIGDIDGVFQFYCRNQPVKSNAV